VSIKNRLQDEIPNIDLKSLQLLLDERKAAYLLGVSLSLLRKSRCEGAIRNRTPGPPFVNVGGRVYYVSFAYFCTRNSANSLKAL